VTHTPLDTDTSPLALRVSVGLAKIGQALKSQAWQDAGRLGLSPTQGQILSLLQGRSLSSLRLSTVAQELGITPATASDAVSAMVDKGLVQKTKADDDRRAIALTLTPLGQQQAERVSGNADFLRAAVEALSPAEQTLCLQALIKIIAQLQEQGQISTARLCLTCQYFRPHVYADAQKPHHCAFVDAPFGDRQLQVDCPDYRLP
jgi:DNA-binding MarR family transcriptional regulator